jgi:hypothetical protein
MRQVKNSKEAEIIRNIIKERRESEQPTYDKLIKIPGKIGNGKKIHSFTCEIVEYNGEEFITYIYSGCGSQKSTIGGGYSWLTLLNEDAIITCKKCI